MPRTAARKYSGVEAERLGAEFGVHLGFDRGTVGEVFGRPEPALVAEAEFGAVVECEDDVQVVRLRVASRARR